MVSYDIKITMLGFGLLILFVPGFLVFFDYPIFCLGCSSNQEPYKTIGNIGSIGVGIGILLMIISFIIPANKIEDDYSHTPLGKRYSDRINI